MSSLTWGVRFLTLGQSQNRRSPENILGERRYARLRPGLLKRVKRGKLSNRILVYIGLFLWVGEAFLEGDTLAS